MWMKSVLVITFEDLPFPGKVFPLGRTLLLYAVRLQQQLVTPVAYQIRTDKGYKDADHGKDQPCPGAVDSRDVYVHSEESCDEGREHQGKGYHSKALHDYVHVVSDDGGECIHRTCEDV